MILQKKTINNVPTLVPLTADTGSGVPVGTIIGQYKKVNMAGYLYLDGSTFDQTLYPALYAYLGTNVLPDYREFVLVGAEQNTTSATIADHDVFTQGQEKDDQLQDHTHVITLVNTSVGGAGRATGASTTEPIIPGSTTEYISTGRHGTTTRTKEKAVFWYIKATTGIIESEATEMLNVINENNSYSTSEINTGKKWIDGKPIYRKVITGLTFGDVVNTWTSCGYTFSDCDSLIKGLARRISLYGNDTLPEICFSVTNNALNYYTCVGFNGCNQIIVEYTKTTD